MGVTASDEEDGDLTDQIVAGSFSRFVDPGVTGLTYVVFDSQGQSASLTIGPVRRGCEHAGML